MERSDAWREYWDRILNTGTMRVVDISKIDDSKYRTVMKPLLRRGVIKNSVILGFDSEWNPETGELLSVQFAIVQNGELVSKVYYTNELNTQSLLGHVLTFLDEVGGRAEIRKMKKVRIYLVAHFAQAEISKITDYLSEFRLRTFNAAMSAEASIGALEEREYENEIRQDGKVRKGKYLLKIIDLYGYFSQALAAVGDLVGLKKLELDRTKIHVVLKQDPKGFEEYAKRDAEICALAFNQLRQMFIESFGLDILYYPTTPGVAAAIFRSRFLKEPVAPYREAPRVYKRQKPDGSWITRVTKETVYSGSLDVRNTALECYWGGRAECYARGFVKGDFEYFDVASLYPSSSLLQPLPNKDTNWIRFQDWEQAKRLEGFCRVQFEFPTGCKFPCLPVCPVLPNKLYFPLRGESHCTLSEARVAVKLGAKINRIDGWGFEPGPAEKNHVLAEFMLHFMKRKNSEKKGTLKYEMWKLIINSLIGKFCQKSPEYDEGEMASYMNSAALQSLSDYKFRKLFRQPPSVGPCWAPEWATLILGKARSLMAEFITKGSLLCSTDSGLFYKGTDLNCDALNELHTVQSNFVKEYEADSVLLVRARMYALMKDGKVVKSARHGTIALNEDFARIVLENMKAGRDLEQTVSKTHLSSLKDVVRKGAKLGSEEIWERQIKWDWDEKRQLINPGIDIWTEFSETMPNEELPAYPIITTSTKVSTSDRKRRESKLGRPPAMTPEQIREIKKLHGDGWSVRRLAKRFGVGIATVQRCLKDQSS